MVENKDIVLSVKDLKINFSTDNGYVQAVRGISFDLYKGETFCIVGESGSGKSVTSKAIMGILAANGRIANGSIMYEGEDLTRISEDEFHRIRGHKIGMIFQDPLSSLNPIVRIGKQITEAMLINSSRLKKLYDDKVAREFVAYKNAITEYKNGLTHTKETVKFLKSEKRKEVSKVKNEAKNEMDGRIYNLNQDYGVEKIKIKKVAEFELLSLDKKDPSYNQKIIEINSRVNKQLAEAKSKYLEEKKKIVSDAAELAKERNSKVQAVKKDFDDQIIKCKTEGKNSKSELKAKYIPLIKQTKSAFKVKSKQAKAEVREYKKQLKDEYNAKVDALINNGNKVATPRKKFIPTIIFGTLSGILFLSYMLLFFITTFTGATYPFNAFLGLSIAFGVLLIGLVISFMIAPSIFNQRALSKEEQKLLAKYKEDYISSIRITKKEAKARAIKIMTEVGIPNPERRFRQYPFEFSGGMRQRIVIAIALTANPDILICDEPTTALDVTIQAQILELINRLKKERNMTCIFITHDLGVVANMADRVAVMYAGKIVEYGTEEEIFYNPKHPYTWALLSSIPDIDSKEKLDAIPGTPPNMVYPPEGDAFALRSKYAMAIDFKKEPPFFKISDTHYAATWLLDPRAPKVEMPKIVKTRIENSLNNAKKEAQ